jgi:hypothetical protein
MDTTTTNEETFRSNADQREQQYLPNIRFRGTDPQAKVHCIRMKNNADLTLTQLKGNKGVNAYPSFSM